MGNGLFQNSQPRQISYMMAEMYSEKEISSQMENPDWRYFLIKDDEGNFGGFIGYQFNYEPKTTKLHRIYMVPESKGKGLGKFALNYLKIMFLKMTMSVLS